MNAGTLAQSLEPAQDKESKRRKSKFSPRLKQHLQRQNTERQEQALLQSTSLPNYVPTMQIPVGKWRNNILFNRIPS